MCFTPLISISVALIEFCLAAILIAFFPKTNLRNFFALIIVLLGFYQLTEFMLCTSSNPLFWARLGFITYTFLPAVALHTTIKFVNKKSNFLLIYLVPVIASIIAFSFKIITSASCQRFFVETQNIFSQIKTPINEISFFAYCSYYFGFTIASCLIFYNHFKKEKNKVKKEIDLVQVSGILLMTIPTLTFIIIFPFLGKRFPSVLCGFAIFVAVAAFIAAYLEGKLKKN
jgi:hypothetical protein